MMDLLFHGVGVYQRHQTFGPACWPHHDLLVIREGAATFSTSAGVLDLQRGDAVLIPPKTRFEGEVEDSKCLLWVVHFRTKKRPHHQLPDLSDEKLTVYRGGVRTDLAEGLMDRLSEMYLGESRWKNPAPLYLMALLADLSHRKQVSADPYRKWILDLEQTAATHLASGVSVGLLAEKAGLSTSHFRKLFQQRYGSSVGKFVQELRLKKAQDLLMQSTLNLKQLSDELGYSDPVAFTRAFSNRFNISPGRFRKQNRIA